MRLLVEDDLEEDSGIQRSLDQFMSEANQETHVEITTVQNEVQSVVRQEPDKEVASSVEQRRVAESSNDQMLENTTHTVESTDDHGQDNGEQCASELIANDQAVVSGEQHSPETVHDWGQDNGEEHVMQPGGNKDQPMDNGEQCLSEADYRRMIDNITVNIISECKGFQNPVLILKKAQERILIGRKLDIVDPLTELEGKTNFIVVDRDKLYQDAFAEISLIDNLRLPLEVNFMGEGARDFGGPRKLFDIGLIEDFAEDYYTSGIIIGLSVLQNGKIPTFLSEEQLQELIDDSSEHSSCIINLQKGLHKDGVLQLMQKLPVFLYLFRPSDCRLNIRNLVRLLDRKFAEECSNLKRYQKEVYTAFYRYTREVSAARRVTGKTTLTLNHILQFTCGADEETVLGFSVPPQIIFVLSSGYFLPS